MKSKTTGYFLLSILISILLFFVFSWILQPSSDEGLLLIIGIIISLQIAFLSGWTINMIIYIKRKIEKKC
ncbi:hypothetical protein BVG16_26700 [Paenibacillus selenitireducens]|uniref:Uncharacterized protein n=1 Tax=Paenibacillus selenitireducens TaxID=1324314 RepID=A0A1T2X1G5_9BACL|nr:hypothetical protein BVG16_26700 [Paenibacillus selenitireducens]